MRFEACSKDIYTKMYKTSSNMELIDQFLKSDHECVRIVDHHWANAKSGYASLKKSIKHYHYGGIEVFMRQGDIYLIKTHS